MAEPAERHVVLVGLMGVGKSTVGRRLAKEMQRPFADADEQVELRAGRAIPAIFRTGGEEEFRRLETEVLADLMGRPYPLVVAAGGGAVSRGQNREVLAPRGFVVWLRASAEFLAARTDTTHRPLLANSADDPAVTLQRLLDERAPLYEAVADVVVDVEPFHAGEDEKPKRAIAQHIAALACEAGAAVPPPAPAGRAGG
ncbi:MAG TPA: shikimate kinase [Acidimicrobiales bacterium]